MGHHREGIRGHVVDTDHRQGEDMGREAATEVVRLLLDGVDEAEEAMVLLHLGCEGHLQDGLDLHPVTQTTHTMVVLQYLCPVPDLHDHQAWSAHHLMMHS